MGRTSKPRSGSLQFWPRKRAKSENPRIRSWPELDTSNLAGFAGYKAGMTHTFYLDKNPNARVKKDTISTSATIVECPPLKPFSLRFYKKTPQGLTLSSEILSKKLDKHLIRTIKLPKETKEQKEPESYDEIRLLVHTQPHLTCIGKKAPEIIELGITGPKDKKLEYAKSLLDKEIKISDILQEQQYVDIHAITTGKGLQGSVRRFGISLKQKKSEKHKRAPGNLGAWTPSKVSFTVAHPGQTGYHQRTEYNKSIMKIGTSKEKINPKQGFRHYGLVKNDFIVIKGSIPGPKKRLIKMIHSIRKKPNAKMELKEIIT